MGAPSAWGLAPLVTLQWLQMKTHCLFCSPCSCACVCLFSYRMLSVLISLILLCVWISKGLPGFSFFFFKGILGVQTYQQQHTTVKGATWPEYTVYFKGFMGLCVVCITSSSANTTDLVYGCDASSMVPIFASSLVTSTVSSGCLYKRLLTECDSTCRIQQGWLCGHGRLSQGTVLGTVQLMPLVSL